jgi:hypothetical protein
VNFVNVNQKAIAATRRKPNPRRNIFMALQQAKRPMPQSWLTYAVLEPVCWVWRLLRHTADGHLDAQRHDQLALITLRKGKPCACQRKASASGHRRLGHLQRKN